MTLTDEDLEAIRARVTEPRVGDLMPGEKEGVRRLLSMDSGGVLIAQEFGRVCVMLDGLRHDMDKAKESWRDVERLTHRMAECVSASRMIADAHRKFERDAFGLETRIRADLSLLKQELIDACKTEYGQCPATTKNHLHCKLLVGHPGSCDFPLDSALSPSMDEPR